MAGFRFIHCADIHLDSPMRGLSAYPGAPVEDMRSATRRALDNLIRWAIEEQVAFVVIAGDLYDGDWPDFQTGLAFAAQMARLGRAGIRVFVVRGNHDAASVITRSLPPQDHVRVFSAKRPETVVIEGLEAAIHGQSFATRAVTGDLASGYPSPVAGHVNIGLLHTALEGRPPHGAYAPCRAEQLIHHGYQYWALGHVHAREVVYDQGPHIVFPGNLQGRTIRETGAKGATLVTVQDGQVVGLEHRPLDVLRWALVEAEIGDCVDQSQALAVLRDRLEAALDAADGRTLAARVRFTGVTAAHAELARDREALREAVRAVGADVGERLWIEKVEAATRPILDRTLLRGRDDAVGEVLAALDEASTDPAAARWLLEAAAPLLEKLPADLKDGLPDLGDPDSWRACLTEVEDMLLSALAEQGGGA